MATCKITYKLQNRRRKILDVKDYWIWSRYLFIELECGYVHRISLSKVKVYDIS